MFDLKLRRIFLIASLPYFLLLGIYLLFTEPLLLAVDSAKELVLSKPQSQSQTRGSPVTKKTTPPNRKIFTQPYQIPNKFKNENFADLIFKYTNAFRTQNGLQPLKKDKNLTQLAFVHSKDMADNNYFGNESPIGLGLEERKSIVCRNIYGGFFENIAKYSSQQQNDDILAREIVDQWINRLQNRANILRSEADRIGIGIVKTASEVIAAQVFSDTVAIFDAPLPLMIKVGEIVKVSGRLEAPNGRNNVRFFLKKHERGFFKTHIVKSIDLAPIFEPDGSLNIQHEMREPGIYELVITHIKHGDSLSGYSGFPMRVM